MTKVYITGKYYDKLEAKISVYDHGVLYGDGVFEGMRVFDGGLFRPRDHLARLGRSARTIGLTVPVDPEALVQIIGEVVRRSGLRDAHVRPIVARGGPSTASLLPNDSRRCRPCPRR